MSRKPYVFHSLSACCACGVQGDDFPAPNAGAYEATGDLYCDKCAGEIEWTIPTTCIEHAYGSTTRLSFQIKVF